MAQRPIKRYALVPTARNGSVTSFHLARVAAASAELRRADRLERMEEIAERERGGADPPPPRM
jgi:hypothetical protein